MLTSDLLLVRRRGPYLKPRYVDTTAPNIITLAEELIWIFEDHQGKSRGELRTALDSRAAESTDYRVQRGLCKLLEGDRCEFRIDSIAEPEEIRTQVFGLSRENHPIVREPTTPVHPLESGSHGQTQRRPRRRLRPRRHAQLSLALQRPNPLRLSARRNVCQPLRKSQNRLGNGTRNRPRESQKHRLHTPLHLSPSRRSHRPARNRRLLAPRLLDQIRLEDCVND
jgi:hypothetical protein